MKKQRRGKRKRSAAGKIGIFCVVLAGTVLVLGISVGAAWLWMNHSGERRLAGRQEALPEQMQLPETQAGTETQEGTEETQEQLEAGSIRYKGRIYTYKKDILTFLFMGIDKSGEVKASSNLFQGGQADSLFLAALDPQEKKISVIGINRDTMAQIDTFDKNGLSAGKQTVQIALAHAYGDGLEESCENTVNAVSNLFYGLPIHGYCALNMSVVSTLNDAVGGVELVLPSSADGLVKGWKAGERVHLNGKEAYRFIRYRDTGKAQSAEERLERQKLYLTAFISQAKKAVQEDMTLPLKLYTQITPYMVTDVTADEAVYLAGEALSYHFSGEDLYSMEGTVKMGEKFEEFYPDETALYELVLKVFYEEG
ncbi:MAG: LCP family protein [Eubacteriales bacterium]|nr:LCP family protein [Eubacteriales bacterium]